MHFSTTLFAFLFLSSPLFAQEHAPLAKPTTPSPQKISSKILVAKTVVFQDQSGVPAVGKAAVNELKKWGRFQIVSDKGQADLLLVLSASPPRGGHIIYSGGQTGTVGKGSIDEDQVPTYPKSGPAREAYLTVYDAKTGQPLWSDEHQWGGLLTGFHSAGASLISKLKHQIEK